MSKNSQESTYVEIFFNKITGHPATLLKNRLQQSYFSVNFTKFLRTHFL